MKKLAFIGIAVVLGLNGFASECKLLLKPSDFQLDKNFAVQNESKVFSKVGNNLAQNHLFGYVGGRFCGSIQSNYNTEKTRACLNELLQLSEEDTMEYVKNSFKDVTNTADALDSQTKSYGLKTSKHTPISEKHLCYLQKKYGDKIISKEDIARVKQHIEVQQKIEYNHYSEMADTVDMSADTNTMLQAFVSAGY